MSLDTWKKWAHIYQIDTFTSEPYKGNPAAICIMPTNLDEQLYLAISSEMNLSETSLRARIDSINPLNEQYFTF